MSRLLTPQRLDFLNSNMYQLLTWGVTTRIGQNETLIIPVICLDFLALKLLENFSLLYAVHGTKIENYTTCLI
jgi:hypothetical protein